MALTRTMRAITESGFGGGAVGMGGLSSAIGTARGMQMPYMIDAEQEADRRRAAARRQQRLKELVHDWARPGEAYGSGTRRMGAGGKKKHKHKKHKGKKHKDVDPTKYRGKGHVKSRGTNTPGQV